MPLFAPIALYTACYRIRKTHVSNITNTLNAHLNAVIK